MKAHLRGGKMKRVFQICIAVALIIVGLNVSFSYAQEQTPGKVAEQAVPQKRPEKVIPEDFFANLNTSFYSKYVWRGLELSKDSLVIFPSATIGFRGFSFNVWTDLDTHFDNPAPGKDKEFKLQETDITLSYTNTFKPLKLNYNVGWIYYDTDGFHGDTPTKNQELFGTLTLDVLLKPTLSVYNEIETGQAWYASFGVSHGFKVYKDWSLDVGGSISYIYNKSSEDINALHDGNVWSGLTIPLTPYASITPKIQYSFPLSAAARDRIEANSFNGNDNNFVYGGVILDLKF
jgi:hypothetical protein